MKESSFENIHSLFIEITKIAASFSIVCAASGFIYLLIYLSILTGDIVFFPISVQDIFMSFRRWGILLILCILLVWHKENGGFNNFIYKCYYSNSFIFKSMLIVSSKVFRGIFFVASLILIMIMLGENIFKYKIVIYIIYFVLFMIFCCVVMAKYISKADVLILICALSVFSAYFDIYSIYNSKFYYKVETDKRVYLGKICLYLSDGIFLKTETGLIYLKNRIIRNISDGTDISSI